MYRWWSVCFAVMMPFFFTVTVSVAPNRLHCPHPEDRIYVYDWPNYLINIWPNLTVGSDDMKLYANANFGTGVKINATIGLHDTFQFSVFNVMYQRILRDPRRTLNPDEATLFFIPYDSGIDATMNRIGKIRTPGCPRALEIISLLNESKYFRRNYGHDHFIVHSVNQALAVMNQKPKCSLYLRLVCENCTKLAIDTYPRCGEAPNWHAIPFPSNVHWSSEMTYVPWAHPYGHREHIVSFTGTATSHSKKIRLLRKNIYDQCNNSTHCHLNTMHSHSSASTPPDWAASLKSVFCLTPPGDMPTRKGFFDSILLGCIPVVCSKWSAHYQWQWNLGIDVALAITLYIPCRLWYPGSGFNVIDHLVGIASDVDEVVMRREMVARHAAALQYRLPETNDELKSRGVVPPPDAYDVIMDNLFDSNRGIMEDLVNNPRDRGDHRADQKYDLYPLGKIHQDWSLENYMQCCYGRRKQPYFNPDKSFIKLDIG